MSSKVDRFAPQTEQPFRNKSGNIGLYITVLPINISLFLFRIQKKVLLPQVGILTSSNPKYRYLKPLKTSLIKFNKS